MTHRGFYERYFITPFFRDFKNYKDRVDLKDMLRTLRAWGVATLGLVGLLLGQVGLLGPEVGFSTLYIIGGIWLLWSAVGLCALFSRYFKSSGDREAYDTPKPVAVLGIDKLLAVVCVLFFIFGILMMATTLNSGELNMSTGTGEYDEDNPILNSDKVEEEAIFNYMNYDETPPVTEDTVSVEEEDTVSLQEIFDPAAVSPSAQEDTTYIE